jgi:hypothetical protein
VEDVLLSANQCIQDLCKEVNKKIDETQVHIKVIKTSLQMQAKSLLENSRQQERPP